MSFYQAVKAKKNQHEAENFNASRDMKVRLEILNGRKLPKCDIGLLAKSDPYCIVSLWNKSVGERKEDRGVELARSKKILKTLNPNWNEVLEFTIKRYKTSYVLYIDVIDWDRFGTHDDMGSVLIDLSAIETNQIVSETVPLGPPFQQQKVLREGSTISYKVTVLSFGVDDRKFLQMAPVRRLIARGRAIKHRNRHNTTLSSDGTQGSSMKDFYTVPIRPPSKKYQHYITGLELMDHPFEPWAGQKEIVSIGIFHSYSKRAQNKLKWLHASKIGDNDVENVEDQLKEVENTKSEKKDDNPLTEAEQTRLKQLLSNMQQPSTSPSRFSMMVSKALKEKRAQEAAQASP